MPDQPQRLKQPEELADRLINAFLATSPDKRLIVAIAGAPASGKSTLAHWLVSKINGQLNEQLNEQLDKQLNEQFDGQFDGQVSSPEAPENRPAIVVPMDGYHLDNAILQSNGWQAVKGAPHTFDVDGFCALIKRLRVPLASSIEGDTSPVYIPVFDRSIDLARCAASAVQVHHRIIVVEGNYLLLDRPGWRDLAHDFDLSVLLEVSLDILKSRLIDRWTTHGMAADAARERAFFNDIPNAITVTEESREPDVVLTGMR